MFVLDRIDLENLGGLGEDSVVFSRGFYCSVVRRFVTAGGFSVFSRCGEKEGDAFDFFDVLCFLRECFTDGGLSSDGVFLLGLLTGRKFFGDRPIGIGVQYLCERSGLLNIYRVEISQRKREESKHFGGSKKEDIFFSEEVLWEKQKKGLSEILKFSGGKGRHVSLIDHAGKKSDKVVRSQLISSQTLAANALGVFRSYPHAVSLRDFVTGWGLFCLSPEAMKMKRLPKIGVDNRLSPDGGNLSNVIGYCQSQKVRGNHRFFHTIDNILTILDRWEGIPKVKAVMVNWGSDGRPKVRFSMASRGDKHKIVALEDAPDALLVGFALAILFELETRNKSLHFLVLKDPDRYLPKEALPQLAQMLQKKARWINVFISTGSPEFLKHVRPDTVRELGRNEDGMLSIHCPYYDNTVREFLAKTPVDMVEVGIKEKQKVEGADELGSVVSKKEG